MKAVSNTTPLGYLIAIEQEHLLGQLFEKVFVPVAVHEELTDSRTPETVRRRVLALPAWFEVRAVQASQKTRFPVTLHRGEREAILLPNRSFLAPSSTTAWAILFPLSQFSGRAVSWVAPYSTVSAHLKLTSSLN
jgi:hypothetical protein